MKMKKRGVEKLKRNPHSGGGRAPWELRIRLLTRIERKDLLFSVLWIKKNT